MPSGGEVYHGTGKRSQFLAGSQRHFTAESVRVAGGVGVGHHPSAPAVGEIPPSRALAMAAPGPYSGVSTLAFVARASLFTVGVVYGSLKLSYLKAKAKSQKKAVAKGHH